MSDFPNLTPNVNNKMEKLGKIGRFQDSSHPRSNKDTSERKMGGLSLLPFVASFDLRTSISVVSMLGLVDRCSW